MGGLRSAVRAFAFLGIAAASLLGHPITSAASTEEGVEACLGCHGVGGEVPVADVRDPGDVHYVDLDPRGPASPSGYRQLDITFQAVDVTGTRVVLDYEVRDEDGSAVADLFASDGRFNVARLDAPALPGDPNEWKTLIRSERFTTEGALFENRGNGLYRYTSAYDPTAAPVENGQTLRVSIELHADDLPAGNGWCDFDASLTAANDCTSPVSKTRDIVRTAVCNECHGATSDTQLVFHRSRTEVEYCVTCHNPGIGETDMAPLIHKIHYGSRLANGFRGYSDVNFTRDVDDCTACHRGGGADELNWATRPHRDACGSCHDTVEFDTGINHGSGGQQLTNALCADCHPASGDWTDIQLPVATVHQGMARAAEAERYRGDGNGFAIEALTYDGDAGSITVDYSVTRDGRRMLLQSDPEWADGGALTLKAGWSTEEYTNEGSGSAPGQPASATALDVGGTVTDLGDGLYRTEIAVAAAFGDLTATLEGRPVADLLGDGVTSRIPVRTAFAVVRVDGRGEADLRRTSVDIQLCNACHDAAGAGLAFHGDNRTSEMQACVVCHNPVTTDINRRPQDPGETPDGKREESVDMKRMIHGIHTGRDLQNGLVLYGFGNRPVDFSHVGFVGNSRNCLTCHVEGGYSADAAAATLASTIDTGEDLDDPSDDETISPISSVCSSCHDHDRAIDHMILNEGTLPTVPEPDGILIRAAALAALAALARRRLGEAS